MLSRAEQSRAEQSRAEQSSAEQSSAEQSSAEQSRAEQSRAEQRAESREQRGGEGRGEDETRRDETRRDETIMVMVMVMSSFGGNDGTCGSGSSGGRGGGGRGQRGGGGGGQRGGGGGGGRGGRGRGRGHGGVEGNKGSKQCHPSLTVRSGNFESFEASRKQVRSCVGFGGDVDGNLATQMSLDASRQIHAQGHLTISLLTNSVHDGRVYTGDEEGSHSVFHCKESSEGG
eukprot:768688-Hanusia_phi.AAC.1